MTDDNERFYVAIPRGRDVIVHRDDCRHAIRAYMSGKGGATTHDDLTVLTGNPMAYACGTCKPDKEVRP